MCGIFGILMRKGATLGPERFHREIQIAAKLGVDYLAVSFPRAAEDMHEARRLLKDAGGVGLVVAKIERGRDRLLELSRGHPNKRYILIFIRLRLTLIKTSRDEKMLNFITEPRSRKKRP